MFPAARFALGLLAAAAAFSAQAGSYVLQAPAWGTAQKAAVEAAGGSVSYSHASGLAVVSSYAPDFLARVLASGAVASGAADVALQQAPLSVVHADAQDLATVNVTDVYSTLQWALQAVQAPAAWAAGYKGKGVRVAVVDGGIWDIHPDLQANIDAAAGRSFVFWGAEGSCEAAWNCDAGYFWHGTHVAGIIAAPLNGIGVVGIAPEATIVPVKVLHNGSGSFGTIIAGILYASTEGRADIINLSLGAVLNRGQPGIDALISSLNKAVNTAGRNGSLVLVAAGNSALDMDHSAQLPGQYTGGDLVVVPAESGNVLAVSATGPYGFGHGATNFTRFSSYSNYGNSLVGVAGPGGDIAWPTDENCSIARANGVPLTRQCKLFDMVLSTSRAAYSWAAGTSSAAPAVAAVAALIKQKYPKASVGELKTRVLRATIDAGKNGNDPYYGKGFINAAKAVAD
jgi:subtilisin family serine protease